MQEELIRAKADAYGLTGSRSGYFQVCNVRESLNQLRVSLNRSLLLPHIDADANEEVNVGEDDIKELRQQIDELYSSCEETFKDLSTSEDYAQFYSVGENYSEADMTSCDEIEKDEVNSETTFKNLASTDKDACTVDTSRAIKSTMINNISVSSCCQSPILDEPMLSESPKIKNIQRKSMAGSSSCLGSWHKLAESSSFSNAVIGQSSEQDQLLRSSLRSSKVLTGPTESLAASLQRGLQIIDYHQRNSPLNKSTASFSFEHLTMTPCPESDMLHSSMGTIQEKPSDNAFISLLCASCRRKVSDQDSIEGQNSLKSSLEKVEEAGFSNGLTDEVPKVCVPLF